jgi:GNAT superfamily N-acetyltransferase
MRPATADEAPMLASIRVEAMRESLERVGRFDEARARARLLDAFDAGRTRAIELDGEVIGLVVLRPIEEGLLLDHLYLRPSHQGLGIGSRVLQQVFAEADARQCTLKVGALRGSEANRFYERHGFVLVEEAAFDNYYLRHPVQRGAAASR